MTKEEALQEIGWVPRLTPCEGGRPIRDVEWIKQVRQILGCSLRDAVDIHDDFSGYPQVNCSPVMSYQTRVGEWTKACFGEEIATDTHERACRFIEECLELVQSTGLTKGEVLQLVEYVYGRPWGDLQQEVGGVMVTLAAFCQAYSVNMQELGDREIGRCWEKIEFIRQKHLLKPKVSPLPE